MLTRWRKQLGKDEVDLASRIDSVTRGSGGGQRVQDGAARIGCLLLEEPRRRGNPFVEESGVRSPPARALLITPSAPGQARSARSRAANGAVSGRRSRSDSGTHTHRGDHPPGTGYRSPPERNFPRPRSCLRYEAGDTRRDLATRITLSFRLARQTRHPRQEASLR